MKAAFNSANANSTSSNSAGSNSASSNSTNTCSETLGNEQAIALETTATKDIACESCNVAACEFTERTAPEFCPQQNITEEMHNDAMRLYNLPENHQIMECAAKVSANTVNSTRVQDTLKFASYMGAKRVGIATCTAMLKETRILAGLLRKAGFEVKAVGCKLESNKKEDLGIEKLPNDSDCPICNPIMQALILNQAQCDINILMGICIGHDALFCKYSQAPAVTLVAKDFMAANNPCAVLYTANGVYKEKVEATISEIVESE